MLWYLNPKNWIIIVVSLSVLLLVLFASIQTARVNSKSLELEQAASKITIIQKELDATTSQLNAARDNINMIKVLSGKLKEIAHSSKIVNSKIDTLTFEVKDDKKAIDVYNNMSDTFNDGMQNMSSSGSTDDKVLSGSTKTGN